MKGKKVLIVDDDPRVIDVLSKLFADAGAEVEGAISYEAGLTAIKKDSPAVAIVDLMLPERSGIELVKETRASAPETFFVILTNSINAENLADAMEANITLFVQKADHDPSEIVQMVASHFEKK
ncbi:MAG: response regulator receiver protein [Parcubacteria group bacterium Gr01-1014_8]|nr:MAG: response regulator receiver protein [Parcubacteria group bacterium Gr01-1014_8]